MLEHREGALHKSAKLGQADNFLDRWIRDIEQMNVFRFFPHRKDFRLTLLFISGS